MGNYKEDKQYHFTYKTTNLTNGKYYLGMHSTNKLSDGYLGSGKRLRHSIRKYGVNNFEFEILKHFANFEEMRDGEIELITDEDIKNLNCMNMKKGGDGGWSIEQQRNGREATNKILKEKYGDDYALILYSNWRSGLTDDEKNEYGKKVSDGVKQHKLNNPNFRKGVNNPGYGTCWITNEVENKRVKKADVLPDGWKYGRVLKKE